MTTYVIRLLEDLKERDCEIALLKQKVTLLEDEVVKLEAEIFHDHTSKYDQIVEKLKLQHKQGKLKF